MQLARRDPSLPFITVAALPKSQGAAPKLTDVPYGKEPANDAGLVSVRYRGVDVHGARAQQTVRNDPTSTGEYWQQLSGSLEDAISAARELAVIDGFTDEPAEGIYGRTSVAVLDAGKGVFQLLRMQFPDGMGDGMDPIISMPIDLVPASGSEVSVPYGAAEHHDFDRPDRVEVRFDDPRVKALVGVDSIALAPKR